MAVLLILCGVLFFYGLSVGEFWRTEGLRAILAQQFLHSGNWVVPTLYGEPFLTKPPGMYIAIALCSLPFGSVTESSARLPSALAATATVFLMYWYVRRQVGPLGGLLAGVITPLSPMWLEKATSAEIDMLHVAWTTAAIVFFLRALEEEEGARLQLSERPYDGCTSTQSDPFSGRARQAWAWWLASLLCVAGGVLTKWTTPLFFYLTAGTLLWWRGELRLLFGWRHISSAIIALSICLMWAIAAIVQEGWPVFAGTVWHEAKIRMMPNRGDPVYPWAEALLHPLKILAVTFPFSPLALIALQPSFFHLWDEKGRRLLQAFHCWTWPSLLFLCLPTEHTPRHSFPLFIGLSGLASMVFLAWMTGKLPWRYRLQPKAVLIGVVVFWMFLKIGYTHAIVAQRGNDRQARAKGTLLASLVPGGDLLYIFQLKDEGIVFYYGRPVLRLPSPSELPWSANPLYCIMLPDELTRVPPGRTVEVISEMTDEQGDPMILVRVGGI